MTKLAGSLKPLHWQNSIRVGLNLNYSLNVVFNPAVPVLESLINCFGNLKYLLWNRKDRVLHDSLYLNLLSCSTRQHTRALQLYGMISILGDASFACGASDSRPYFRTGLACFQ